MKIILQLEVEGRANMNDGNSQDKMISLQKEYESSVIPHVDDYIFVGGFKKEEARVVKVVINYDSDTCYVSVKTHVKLELWESEIRSLLEEIWKKK